MEQEPTDEFIGGQAHRFDLTARPLILPLKADLIVFDVEQGAIGGCHAAGIAAHIVKDLPRAGKGALGRDHPLGSFRSA
jgi:hypothetical protein